MALAVLVPLLLVGAADPVPEADDVTAGWIAALVFAFLIVAVAFLGRSLVKQLRKAQAAHDAGVYGDEPAQATGQATGQASRPVTGPVTGPTTGPATGQPPDAAPR